MTNFSNLSHEDIHKMSEGIQKWATEFFNSANSSDIDPHNLANQKRVAKLMQEAMMKMFTQNPMELWQAQMNLWHDYVNIWQKTLQNAFNPGDKVNEEKAKDNRFKSDAWREQPYFNFIKECYLATSEHINSSVSKIEGLDDKTTKEVEFYTKQMVDALSPSNFVLTNPDVLEETVKSKGQNLVKGFENMLEDMKRNDGSGVTNFKMTDFDQFTIGENIAITPGKVIFENRMLQLIQYSPQTEQVQEIPLLIIPPFINKYYILDLTKKKSLVNWIVSQGYTVYMISWVNPDETYRDTKFEDYMTQGLLPAFDEVLKATNQKKLNVIGYCIGGTLLSATLSYLKQKRKNIINSVTYFTALIDFADPGELGVFLSEDQVKDIIKEMNDIGYLDGRRLAASFNLLRSNDLVWNYYINNYLCGKEPFPFDLLYWNCDSTNMAASSHAYYLTEMYTNNNLSKPNALEFDGVKIDVSKVNVPTVFISAEKDHIAPWTGTYTGAKLLSGDVDFILGGSGHIAGIVNPPEKQKYGFKTNKKLYDTPEEWDATSTHHEGSWWPYWEETWLRPKSGEKIAAREPKNTIEDAPGRYVKKSILDKK
jgi:polyhydroxyalkanoate synthase